MQFLGAAVTTGPIHHELIEVRPGRDLTQQNSWNMDGIALSLQLVSDVIRSLRPQGNPRQRGGGEDQQKDQEGLHEQIVRG